MGCRSIFESFFLRIGGGTRGLRRVCRKMRRDSGNFCASVCAPPSQLENKEYNKGTASVDAVRRAPLGRTRLILARRRRLSAKIKKCRQKRSGMTCICAKRVYNRVNRRESRSQIRPKPNSLARNGGATDGARRIPTETRRRGSFRFATTTFIIR